MNPVFLGFATVWEFEMDREQTLARIAELEAKYQFHLGDIYLKSLTETMSTEILASMPHTKLIRLRGKTRLHSRVSSIGSESRPAKFVVKR